MLSFIKTAQIANTVWLTADVHYTAAHHYAPDRAVFQDFDPFWEFVSGPLHAGTFGPSDYDNTFGPEVRFAKHPGEGQANLPPSDGLQFFGKVDIAADTGEMTVRLMDSADVELWSVVLEAEVWADRSSRPSARSACFSARGEGRSKPRDLLGAMKA